MYRFKANGKVDLNSIKCKVFTFLRGTWIVYLPSLKLNIVFNRLNFKILLTNFSHR